jgi:hypothetical protein
MHLSELLSTLQKVLVDWLAHGLSGFSAWQIVVYTLVITHITIAAVTIFLHRSQTHRSVELHALPARRPKTHTARRLAALQPCCCAAVSCIRPPRRTGRCSTSTEPACPTTGSSKNSIRRTVCTALV